jgi:hypothetical protein
LAVRLVRVGYWLGPQAVGWPDPGRFVDPLWDAEERQDVASYLRRGVFARAMMGYSTCRFCGRRNGSVELSDGVYVWPEGLGHYVEEHDVRLPDEFVDHVRGMTECLEEAEVDEIWWRGQPGFR